MYLLRWLTSKTVRRAAELNNQVRKILNHQRDELAPAAVEAVEAGITRMRAATHGTADKAALQAEMTALEETANKWLKPYPHPGLRENLDVVLVAGAVALAIRTFFVQPMVIPTGSAQPTFFGITQEDLRDRPEVQIPSGFKRFYERWWKGISYYEVVAEADGDLQQIDREPKRLLFFIKRQSLLVGGRTYTVWFPPDDFARHLSLLDERLGTLKKAHFKKGEPIIRASVKAGDHLFVNRMTYNFRQPRRGETIVFQSLHHPGMTPETHYIKRLIALDGERVRIGDDRHVYINGRRLEATDPGFEFVYSFDPKQPPRSDHYSGHVNGEVWRRSSPYPAPTPNFPDGKTEFTVRPGHYLTFGDNTMNSADSRYWPVPDFPQERVVGKSGFVFWPISDRFGWGQW